MENKRLEYLEKIFHQQHYFIERHDSMAEKFIHVLLVEATCFAFIFGYVADKGKINIWQAILVCIFLISFIVSLCQLFLIVRPLSTKAKKREDESLIKAENKKWISHSSIYYQGIVAQVKKAKEKERVPSDEYLSHINDEEIERDYLQQIFILAQYSVYKKKKLETALGWIMATTFLGVFTAVVLLLFVSL